MLDLRTRAALVAASVTVALCALAVPALAAPVTVDFRIEGKDTTHFDGPVTSDVRAVDGHDGTGPHTCDGTNNGQGGTPAATAGTSLAEASERAPFSFVANYFPPSAQGGDDMFLSTVNGETPDFNVDQTFWGFVVNGSFASVGMCQFRVQPGDRILFARMTGSETILQLAGPSTVSTGAPATYTVTDAASGAPLAGATVGGQLTGADGKAMATFDSPGTRTLKATRANSIRSNGVVTCVHAGDDGTCGTNVPGGGPIPASRAPTSSVLGLRLGQRFGAGRGPRLLRGHVDLGTGALAAVRLRLRRVFGGRCFFWSVRAEKWRRRPCNAGGFFYTIGDRVDWSYLLPARLGPGRYDMHALALDRARLRHDAYVLFYVARGR
jgi:Domain of unknown function (DUF4430)